MANYPLTQGSDFLSDSIGVALVGAGYWGKNLARNFYQLNALRMICDPSEEILERKSSKFPDVAMRLAFTEVLASRDIDAVAIATPAELHYSMARDALLAGKHVFVEKPLAVTEREGADLVKLAREVGRVLFVGHILQYHPAIIEIKRMIREGELGRLQYIYSNRLNLGKFRREENILWSFAPHDLSVILAMAGEEPSSVKAVGSNILHPKIADTTLTHLEFKQAHRISAQYPLAGRITGAGEKAGPSH
jgi:UDP-2-acetamido-3-amino-2,3-dideoxy-glucuronate N-acetyltransferase